MKNRLTKSQLLVDFVNLLVFFLVIFYYFVTTNLSINKQKNKSYDSKKDKTLPDVSFLSVG